MPTYTMELFRAMEFRPDLGLTEYPIFDESYRVKLNKKITDHYYNREIGQETLDMFIFALKRRMNEIMPLYNQLYLSERLVIDPLRTMDIHTLTTGESATTATGNSVSTSESDTESGSRAVQSTTPQMLLRGDADYASSAADTNSKSKATGTGNENSESHANENSSGDSHMTGYQGVPAELLNAFRRTFLNIDMMIIDDLSDLFMGVWDNGQDQRPYPFTPLPSL